MENGEWLEERKIGGGEERKIGTQQTQRTNDSYLG